MALYFKPRGQKRRGRRGELRSGRALPRATRPEAVDPRPPAPPRRGSTEVPLQGGHAKGARSAKVGGGHHAVAGDVADRVCDERQW